MVYLDNGATSFPKPQTVGDEMRRCLLTYGGNPGRGAHSLSLAAARRVFECRELCAETFGAREADRIFFTPNATFGLNVVIKGILRKGDHAIISDMEHNAVWRPIHKLASEGVIEYSVFKTYTDEPYKTTRRICDSLESAFRPNTRLVVCTHASNICSVKLPIKEIGEICRRHGALFAVDGAQSAGHAEIDVSAMGIDALCLPGHKGLYGPQGSGVVVLGENVVLDTLVEGGNGVDSLRGYMPEQAPERYEAGTVSVPCIVGLYRGLQWLKERGINEIAYRENAICRRINERLTDMKGVTVYAPRYDGNIALFNIDGIPSETVAAELDRRGICVRGGYHCAALAHKALRTPEGGAVRASVGAFNKLSHADALCDAVLDVSKQIRLYS